MNLRIQSLSNLADLKNESVEWLINECEQLIRILGKIIANKKVKLQANHPDSES